MLKTLYSREPWSEPSFGLFYKTLCDLNQALSAFSSRTCSSGVVLRSSSEYVHAGFHWTFGHHGHPLCFRAPKWDTECSPNSCSKPAFYLRKCNFRSPKLSNHTSTSSITSSFSMSLSLCICTCICIPLEL